MCDINQRWDVRQAISIGSRVEEYHLFWLEDVVAHDDYPGLAAVADALDTPIAAGEYVYGLVPFRHMLEARSVDIVMVDVLRAGGISQWVKIAGMAEAFNLPIVNHLTPGDFGASRRRRAQRPDGRIHAVVGQSSSRKCRSR